jgi:hypothetical protein
MVAFPATPSHPLLRLADCVHARSPIRWRLVEYMTRFSAGALRPAENGIVRVVNDPQAPEAARPLPALPARCSIAPRTARTPVPPLRLADRGDNGNVRRGIHPADSRDEGASCIRATRTINSTTSGPSDISVSGIQCGLTSRRCPSPLTAALHTRPTRRNSARGGVAGGDLLGPTGSWGLVAPPPTMRRGRWVYNPSKPENLNTWWATNPPLSPP